MDFNPVADPVTLTADQTLNVPFAPAGVHLRGERSSTRPQARGASARTGVTSSFLVTIGGRVVVNDLVGSQWMPPVSDGIYATTGGAVAITNSTGVSWTFTEVR